MITICGSRRNFKIRDVNNISKVLIYFKHSDSTKNVLM